MIYQTFIEPPIGRIGIAEEEQVLTHLFFHHKKSPTDAVEKSTPFLREVAKQLKEYLAGKRKKFDLPLKLYGTDFQLSVWKATRRMHEKTFWGYPRPHEWIMLGVVWLMMLALWNSLTYWNPHIDRRAKFGNITFSSDIIDVMDIDEGTYPQQPCSQCHHHKAMIW
jgi:hypothetical protein